jgi:hypothetical protein
MLEEIQKSNTAAKKKPKKQSTLVTVDKPEMQNEPTMGDDLTSRMAVSLQEPSKGLVTTSFTVLTDMETSVIRIVQNMDLEPCSDRCRHQPLSCEAQIVCSIPDNIVESQELTDTVNKARQIVQVFDCACEPHQHPDSRRFIQLISPGLYVKSGAKKDMCGPELEEIFDFDKTANQQPSFFHHSVPVEAIFSGNWYSMTGFDLDGTDIRPWNVLPDDSLIKAKLLEAPHCKPTVKHNLCEAMGGYNGTNLSPPQSQLRNMANNPQDISVLYRKFLVGQQLDGKSIFLWAVILRPTKQPTTTPDYVRGIYWDYDVLDPMAASVILPAPTKAPSWWGGKTMLSMNKRSLIACPVGAMYTIYHLLMGFVYLHTRVVHGFDLIRLFERKDTLPDIFTCPRHSDTVQVGNKPIAHEKMKALNATTVVGSKRKVGTSKSGPSKRPQSTIIQDPDAQKQIEHKQNQEKYRNLWDHILDVVKEALSDKTIDSAMARWRIQQEMRLVDFYERHPQLTPMDVDTKALRRSIDKRYRNQLMPMLNMLQTEIDLTKGAMSGGRGKKRAAEIADLVDIKTPYLYDMYEQTRNPTMRVFDESSHSKSVLMRERINSAVRSIQKVDMDKLP